MQSHNQIVSIFSKIQENGGMLIFNKNKQVQSDRAAEFKPSARILENDGIVYCLTCSHTFFQNGMVEFRYRHVVDAGFTILFKSSVPLKF